MNHSNVTFLVIFATSWFCLGYSGLVTGSSLPTRSRGVSSLRRVPEDANHSTKSSKVSSGPSLVVVEPNYGVILVETPCKCKGGKVYTPYKMPLRLLQWYQPISSNSAAGGGSSFRPDLSEVGSFETLLSDSKWHALFSSNASRSNLVIAPWSLPPNLVPVTPYSVGQYRVVTRDAQRPQRPMFSPPGLESRVIGAIGIKPKFSDSSADDDSRETVQDDRRNSQWIEQKEISPGVEEYERLPEILLLAYLRSSN